MNQHGTGYRTARRADHGSTDVIGHAAVSVGLAAGLLIWLGIFLALATASVRATAETV